MRRAALAVPVVVTLAAGLGLRQGEVFGLPPDDVDFLRGQVKVVRQVTLFSGSRQVFAAPKGRKVRTVPLPDSVRDELAAYLTECPTKAVTLPLDRPEGDACTTALVVTGRESKAVNRNYFNSCVWKKGAPSLRCGTNQRERTTGVAPPSQVSGPL